MRPATNLERLTFAACAARVQGEDAELAGLFRRLADGDDGALPQVFDRLNVLGRYEQADRLRRLMAE